MSGSTLICRDCGSSFELSPEVAARYPGWKPSRCRRCYQPSNRPSATAPKARKPRKKKSRSRKKVTQKIHTIAEVLDRYQDGPSEGIFTDGACSGNPGPGGWGVVWVESGQVIARDHGHDPDTTNNRMELLALIKAYELATSDTNTTIYSDSNLCVQTINTWARGWKKLGWKRKTGPVQNLDLVKKAYALSLQRPGMKLRWIKAHDGSLWNEYADALATAYLREEL